MKPIVFISRGSTKILKHDEVVADLQHAGYIVVEYAGLLPVVYPEENAVELPDHHTA